MKDLSLIIFPVILAGAHLLGITTRFPKYKRALNLEAFSAGFSIAYVFVILIPEIFKLNHVSDPRWPMVLILVGFSFFHVSLKFVYTKLKRADKSLLSEIIHLGAMSTFSLVLAYSVTELASSRLSDGLFLMIFAVVHIFLSEMWENNEFHNQELTGVKPLVMICMTMLGGVLSVANVLNSHITTGLYSFVAGALIYIAVREELPRENTGRSLSFLLGAFPIIFAFLIIEVL